MPFLSFFLRFYCNIPKKIVPFTYLASVNNFCQVFMSEIKRIVHIKKKTHTHTMPEKSCWAIETSLSISKNKQQRNNVTCYRKFCSNQHLFKLKICAGLTKQQTNKQIKWIWFWNVNWKQQRTQTYSYTNTIQLLTTHIYQRPLRKKNEENIEKKKQEISKNNSFPPRDCRQITIYTI